MPTRQANSDISHFQFVFPLIISRLDLTNGVLCLLTIHPYFFSSESLVYVLSLFFYWAKIDLASPQSICIVQEHERNLKCYLLSRTVLIFKTKPPRKIHSFIYACGKLMWDLCWESRAGPTVSNPIVWKSRLDLAGANETAAFLKNLQSTGCQTREMP